MTSGNPRLQFAESAVPVVISSGQVVDGALCRDSNEPMALIGSHSLAQSLGELPERLAGVIRTQLHLDQARTTRAVPRRVQGRVEFAFGTDQVAGAAAQNFRQLVVLPTVNLVVLPIAFVQETFRTVTAVVQDNNRSRKTMTDDRG